MSVQISAMISRSLQPNEAVVGVAWIHPVVVIVPACLASFGLMLTLVAIVMGERGYALALLGIPLAFLVGLFTLARLGEFLTTEFSCTNRRILIKSGLFTTRLRDMPLGKVEALLVEQGPLGRIFGYGTLVFKGSGGTRRVCPGIVDPFVFYRCVQEQMAIAQERR